MTVREGETWPLAHRHGLRDRDPDLLHLHALSDLSDLQALFGLLLSTDSVSYGHDSGQNNEHHDNDHPRDADRSAGLHGLQGAPRRQGRSLHLLKRFGLLGACSSARRAGLAPADAPY
jgi:hypothetical protein